MHKQVFSALYFHTKPFDHQLRAMEFLLVNQHAALFMEMGTGKTKTILDYIVNRTDLRKILIVCPLSVISVWYEQIYLHAPTLLKDGMVVEKASELGKKRIDITNFEKARSLAPQMATVGYNLIVIDESVKIKNMKALVTKRLCWLARHIPNRIIMSGAPIVKDELDLFSQFLFLDQGKRLGKSWFTFRAEHFESDAFGWCWKPKPQAHANIRKAIDPICFRIRKEECLDLPEKVYEKILIPMTKEQASLYQDMLKKFEIQINEQEKLDTKWVLAQITFLQEIASGYVRNPITSTHRAITNNKLSYLEDILETMQEKVIVWTKYNQNIKDIQDMLQTKFPDRPLYTLSSDMDEEQRGYNIKNFNLTHKPAVFVCSMAIGGYGINLTTCSKVIYYSNSFNRSDRMQSEDRVHRPGQKNKCLYIDLVTQNTIEEQIYEAIRNTRDIIDSIINKLKRRVNASA